MFKWQKQSCRCRCRAQLNKVCERDTSASGGNRAAASLRQSITRGRALRLTASGYHRANASTTCCCWCLRCDRAQRSSGSLALIYDSKQSNGRERAGSLPFDPLVASGYRTRDGGRGKAKLAVVAGTCPQQNNAAARPGTGSDTRTLRSFSCCCCHPAATSGRAASSIPPPPPSLVLVVLSFRRANGSLNGHFNETTHKPSSKLHTRT